jgi:hypothetical protein
VDSCWRDKEIFEKKQHATTLLLHNQNG